MRQRPRQRPRQRRPARNGRATVGADPDVFADALEVVVSALRAGLPPLEALRIMAESTEWGRLEHRRGGRLWPIAQVSDQARMDDPDGRRCRRIPDRRWVWIWRPDRAPADAVTQVAGHLREQARCGIGSMPWRQRPARHNVPTLLPLVGPLLAVLVGADPMSLYASSPVAAGSALLGLALTAVGWRWSRRLVTAAARPRRYPSGLPTISTQRR